MAQNLHFEGLLTNASWITSHGIITFPPQNAQASGASLTIYKHQDGVVTCDGVLSEAESGLDNADYRHRAGAGHATVRVTT